MSCESMSPAGADLSRRTLVLASALIPIPALLGCRTLPHPPTRTPDGVDEQLGRLAEAYRDLASRERDLPGLLSLAEIETVALAGLSPSKQKLLAAALIVEVRERAGRVRRPIVRADVREALSRPIDVSRYKQSFLERTLADAEARMERDPGYRAMLQQQQGPVDRFCDLVGVWLCLLVLWTLIILGRILIVIIDIIIVILE